MNLIDLLKQNPVTSVVIIVAVAIGIAWRTFIALYVKPRDFRINCLTTDLGHLKEEFLKLQRDVEHQPRALSPVTQQRIEVPSVDIDPLLPPKKPLPSQVNPDSPLSSLAACYNRWDDDSLTELQKQKFETNCKGKTVSWVVEVDSVSEASYGQIYLSVIEKIHEWDNPRAFAVFTESDQQLLLSLNSGDRIRLQGMISKFFLCPQLTACQVESIG